MARVSRRATFTKALIHWMQGTEWQVGLTGKGIEPEEGVELVKALLPAAAAVVPLGGVGALVSPFLDTDSEAEDVTEALTPYVDVTDVFGLHRCGRELLAVVYADDLTADDIAERLDLFVAFSGALRRLGGWLRRGTSPSWIIAALVYFDSAKCRADFEATGPSGIRVIEHSRALVHGAYLETRFLDIDAGEVLVVPWRSWPQDAQTFQNSTDIWMKEAELDDKALGRIKALVDVYRGKRARRGG